ncbi:hypothetical protein ID0607_14050 [Helicobacter pylori]
MSGIKEKTMKAFKVDLDNKENQNIILKPRTHPFNNQAHQVDKVAEKIAEKIYKLIEDAKHPNDDTILNHNKIKEAFFSPFEPQLKTLKCSYRIRMRIKIRL